MKLIWSFLVLLIFIILGVYFLDMNKVLQKLGSAEPFFVLFATLILLVHFFVRAERLNLISKLSNRIYCYKVIFLSNFLNLILPLRIGELSKVAAFHLVKKSIIESTFIVFTERIFDLLIVLSIFGYLAGFINTNILIQKYQIIFFFVALAVGLIGFQVTRVGLLTRFLFYLKLPKKILQIGFQLEKLAKLNYPILVIHSILIWSLTAFFHFLTVKSMGLEISFSEVLVLTLLNSLFISVPGSPGFIGPYQASFAIFAQMNGYDVESFVAVGILSHILNYILILPLGLFSLASLGLKISSLVSIPATSKNSS